MLCVVLLTQSLRFVELLAASNVNIVLFFKILSFLSIPILYICIPIALFLSVMFTFHNLNTNHELVVLRASGISDISLFKSMLPIISFAFILHMIISAYLMPLSYKSFRDLQYDLRENIIFSAFEEGVFNTQNKSLTIYIDAKESNGLFKGVLIYDSRNEKEHVTILAQEGMLRKTNSGINFLLKNGSRQAIDYSDKTSSLGFFQSYKFNLSNEMQIKERKMKDFNELFLIDLILEKDEALTRAKIVALFQRIIWPLFNFIIVAFAMAALLRYAVMGMRKSNVYAYVITITLGLLLCAALMILNHLAIKYISLLYFCLLLLSSLFVLSINSMLRKS